MNKKEKCNGITLNVDDELVGTPKKIETIEVCDKELLHSGLYGSKVNDNFEVANSINTLINEIQDTRVKLNEIIDYINRGNNE